MKYIILSITIYSTIFICKSVFASNSYECNYYNSCEECIKGSSKCVWCAEIHFNGTRCRSEKENLKEWCVDNKINPKSNKRPSENPLPFNSKTDEVVQIKPQKITIDLRPGDSIDFDFSIKLAKDYRVDLYFLVHATNFMREEKQRIIDDCLTIIEEVKQKKQYVYFGTGVFIDKDPFNSPVNSTYSFRNRLKLTRNYQEFQDAVNDSWFGSSANRPEGTLDALSQVISCDPEILWGNYSTKIIIVLTYGPFRSAGKANWAGIYRPYDGNCYTEHGIYKNELKMDYPSVSIINKLASEKEAIIIFMGSNKKRSYNALLKKGVKDSEVSVIKKTGFSLDVLREQFQKIKQYLKLEVNMDPTLREYIKLSFSPACNLEKTLKECQIHIDEETKFTTKVTLLKNIEADNVDVGILFAKGIKEKLNLNINIIKTCNCSVTKKATQCSSKGTLRCGKCECNEDRTGKKCECDKKSPGMNPNDNSPCISPASSDGGIICSGHGACVCGECICINKDYTGSYCQCHKNMCPQYNDMACSDHGKCICGECICDPDFTGKDCRFSMAKNNCMDGETECNGRGECIYNNCECKDPSAWDARRNGDLCQLKYSEKSGHSHQCQLLEPIVQCYLNQGGCEPNTEINITGVINLPGNNSANDMANNTANYSENSTVIYISNATANNSADAWFDCPNIKTGLGCYTAFLYRYNEDSYGMKIIVQTNANCAETYYKFGGICAVLLIASGVIGLVAWKYITTIRDKREYERFVNEAGIIGSTCENPLYAPTTTTYSNPNFRKRSNRRKFSLN
ncbi:integrin beta pat-3-like [Pararge aegeria]|uniref:integrin beta pat-3-like n=1 Tax=Pararge aegeria TaxID=116150 RepID=UPI0019D2E85A|nr:integrin beta pat-3-like [Pararge aegeria]